MDLRPLASKKEKLTEQEMGELETIAREAEDNPGLDPFRIAARKLAAERERREDG